MKALPKTLYDTYERILQNVPDNDKEFLRRGLAWIMWSQKRFRSHEIGRGINMDELAEAMILEPDSKTLDLDADFVKQVPGICGSLVRVERVEKHIHGQSGVNLTYEMVSLAHFSVQEYLTSEEAKSWQIKELDGKRLILDSCLTYLQLSNFDGKTDEKMNTEYFLSHAMRPYLETAIAQTFRLYYHCAHNWHDYITSPDDQHYVLSKATVLFSSSPVSRQFQFLMEYTDRNNPNVDPLQYISKFDFPLIAKGLIQDRHADVFYRDSFGRTAIHIAACNSNVETVKVLGEIMGKIYIDLEDDSGLTALHLCIQRNALRYKDCRLVQRHRETASALLELGADPNHAEKYGHSILYDAAYRFDLGIISILLKNGGDPVKYNMIPSRILPTRKIWRPDMSFRSLQHELEFLQGLRGLGVNIQPVQPPMTELEYQMLMIGIDKIEISPSPTTLNTRCESDPLEIALALLDSHEDFFRPFGDSNSHSPFTYAVACGYYEIIDKMVGLGASLNLLCMKGDRWLPAVDDGIDYITPLRYAMQQLQASSFDMRQMQVAEEKIRFLLGRGIPTADTTTLNKLMEIVCHNRQFSDSHVLRELICRISDKSPGTPINLVELFLMLTLDHMQEKVFQTGGIGQDEIEKNIELFEFLQEKGFKMPEIRHLKSILIYFRYNSSFVNVMAPLFAKHGYELCVTDRVMNLPPSISIRYSETSSEE